jgi:hypothetical protein
VPLTWALDGRIREREEFFAKDRAWVNEGDVGLAATNRFTGEPARDAVSQTDALMMRRARPVPGTAPQ